MLEDTTMKTMMEGGGVETKPLRIQIKTYTLYTLYIICILWKQRPFRRQSNLQPTSHKGSDRFQMQTSLFLLAI